MEIPLSRPVRVKDKSPAPIQITAEQILREARELNDAEFQNPPQRFADCKELGDYRLCKRKEFENLIRRGLTNKNVFIKYAKWEESQKDFVRVRSVWERALDFDYKDHTIWMNYAEFEMRSKCINHAINVYDRAVTLLPRVDQLWYKYIHMEEMLENVDVARQIFERWMSSQPDEKGWLSYVRFELRYNEVDRAREIYERFVDSNPNANAWISYAEFEIKNLDVSRARNCFERAVSNTLVDDDDAEKLFVAFTEFEEKCKNTDKARSLYQLASEQIPEEKAEELRKRYLEFEKKYGEKEDIEDAILVKKRFQYEEELKNYPFDYDIWLDFIALEMSYGNKQQIEDLYKRAIARKPPVEEKHYWQPYIYLWINYALYEELEAQNVERAREIYNLCLHKTIPHKKFTFSKIWLMAALLEIRQLDIDKARRILGTAIGMAPKAKTFKKYIEIESQLGNFDRCRKIYKKYLEWSPENCHAWVKFADLEISLGETERARSIFELAINELTMNMPEVLWKAYIDFEISEGEYGKVRDLYERLLCRSKHLKVWISYAKFEASAFEGDDEQRRKCLECARAVFSRGLDYFRTDAPDLKEERLMLLEEWLGIESSFGEIGDANSVRAMLPMKLKKRRHIDTVDDSGYEEYIDLIFPEDKQESNLKILEAAYKWKKQKLATV